MNEFRCLCIKNMIIKIKLELYMMYLFHQNIHQAIPLTLEIVHWEKWKIDEVSATEQNNSISLFFHGLRLHCYAFHLHLMD